MCNVLDVIRKAKVANLSLFESILGITFDETAVCYDY